jgi:Icc-related predicted phosphoesterase
MQKFITCSDIHQFGNKWKQLVSACKEHSPNYVLVSGDLIPKDRPIDSHLKFIDNLKNYAKKIKDLGCELVLILGNDDNNLLIPYMESCDKNGLWHYVNESVKKVGDFEFAGLSDVPDYPFQYKYWCSRDLDSNPRMSSSSFGPALFVNEENKIVPFEDYENSINAKDSIEKKLQKIYSKVKDPSKSIWLIHAPPSGMDLDVCANGFRAGSNAVKKFLDENNILMSIHGHIHESLEYNDGKWIDMSKNCVIQNGQVSSKLYYSIVEIENYKVVKANHSIVGEFNV